MRPMDCENGKTCVGTGWVNYMLANIYLTYIAWYFILHLGETLGRVMPSKEVIGATLLMSISCVACILASFLITKKRFGTILNVAISTEVFLMALHVKEVKGLSVLLIILLAGIMLLAIIYFWTLIKSRRIPCKQSVKKLFIVERFLTAAFCPVVIFLVCIQNIKLTESISGGFQFVSEGTEINEENGIRDYWGESGAKLATYDPSPVYGDAYMLSNNLDRIKPIATSGEWEALTLEQRQDTMRAVAECELRYLGIPFSIDIQFVDLEDKNTLAGYYTPGIHQISFNNYALMEYDNEENLETALHEVRHVYQVCMCDIYKRLSDEERALDAFYGMDKWCTDFDNYNENEQDKETYWLMSVEREARSYAKKEAEVYISEIGKHLANQ